MAIEAGLGGGAYGATVTASGSANTKGAWVELLASTSEAAQGVLIAVSTYNNATAKYLIDIGIGGAGAETVLVANVAVATGAGGVANVNLPAAYVPVAIAAGTRISARCQSSTGGAALVMAVYVVGGTSSATVATYGADTSDSGGATVDPGAVANTKGAYTELTAATSADHDRLVAIITGRGNGLPATALFRFDIATGGSGSETIVVPDVAFSTNGAACSFLPCVFSFPLSIASGTRLAARAASQTTEATDRLFDLVVLGISNSQPSGGGGAFAYAFMG